MLLDPSLISKAIPVGSSRYYSLRFSPAALRPDLQILLIWYREVSAIPRLVSDQQVAQAKLSWWYQELHQAIAGQSKLPLAQALSKLINKYQLPVEIFDQIVAAVMHDLTPTPHDDWPSLEHYAQQMGGNLADLLCRVSGAESADDLKLAGELGSFICLVELMQELGLSLRRHSNPIPTMLMQQHALSHQFLDADDAPQQLAKLLAEMTQHLQDRYKAAARQTEDQKPQLQMVLIQAELASALLNTLQKSDFMVLDQRISLTPLRKLWLAWRCSKRKTLKI
ncbi:MAG: squalene/phytoene synthase family protein [Candidatus Polarisedimenticolaceae bacterium]|nr:squalene/phytoene synthase family protein [Candidatus Polarisedimenticolaceae bacterium]